MNLKTIFKAIRNYETLDRNYSTLLEENNKLRLSIEELKSLSSKKSEEVLGLQLKLQSKVKEEELESYWNNRREKIVPKWKARDGIEMDLRCFFQIDDTLPKFKGSNDEIASDTLAWVVTNMRYELDKGENWQYAYETLKRKIGDCEDVAILTANILLMSGVPYWRVRLNKGWVTYKGQKTYHCWCNYLKEADNTWYVLDGAYYPKDSLGLKLKWKSAEKYLLIDTSWNKLWGFGGVVYLDR